MQILTLDFETYFDADYTLKRMTTEEYVRSPLFEALCLGVRFPDGSCTWIAQENIRAFLASYDWTKTAVLHHHAHFDALILSHHYGIRPCFIFDTLSMARAKLGNHVSKSLGSLAKMYGLEEKSVPYDMFKGRRWMNLYEHERQALGDGACGDCRINFDLFQRLGNGFPSEEFGVIDDTVRMFTEPQVYGDTPMLDGIIVHEEERKQRLLSGLGIDQSDLRSADKFVRILTDLEIDVEYKQGKNGLLPAIAKTDEFMKSLLADPDEFVSTLAEARLAVKSTLAQTRAGRMANMSRRGPMCVYLAYAAAHTLRFGGGDSMNWQNLPRIKPDLPMELVLRNCIAAPADHMIVAPDSSQIECRIVNWLAAVSAGNDPKDNSVLQAFAAGRDVYGEAASKFYGRTIDKKTDPLERQLFKNTELGCGFGMGAPKFQSWLRAGVSGPPVFIELSQAQGVIQFYRDDHPDVQRLWARARSLITHLAGFGSEGMTIGPVKIMDGYIEGPNGLRLLYPGLEFNYTYPNGDVLQDWSYQTRNGRSKLYGGKLVENIVQFLARIVVTQAWGRIRAKTGLRPWLSTHDDLAYIIHKDHAKDANNYFIGEMRQTPEWMPGIPLDAESEPSERYVK